MRFPLLFTHREIDQEPLWGAATCVAPIQVPLEKTQILQKLHLEWRIRCGVFGLVRARIMIAAVTPRADEDPLWIRQCREPVQHAVRSTGIHPTAPRLNRYARALDGFALGMDSPVVHGPAAPLLRAVISIGDAAQSLPDRRHMPASLNRRRQQPCTFASVHRLDSPRAVVVTALHVKVHVLDIEAPVPTHVGVRQPAREVKIGVRIVVGEPRDHRLQCRVVSLCHPVCSIGAIGGPESCHLPIGPWLPSNPVNDFAEIPGLVARTMMRPHAEGCACPPHVPDDDSETMADPEFHAVGLRLRRLPGPLGSRPSSARQ